MDGGARVAGAIAYREYCSLSNDVVTCSRSGTKIVVAEDSAGGSYRIDLQSIGSHTEGAIAGAALCC
ncbi:unnamed protein product [Rotaria sordida]|uniref:Uncharacterized protein n=1 Tax=Rotaria sordida TaxID=392033 RepID=A0A814RVR4_9BILA|nr:unnamed protein product [Rotaria sordida]CAF4168347.1 unnamed protein product [Rotaria sordida]